MILKQLKLHNFRGYKDIEVDFDRDINVIVGKNDVGKSTILEALEIFFNSEQVKLDSNDLYVNHDEDDEKIIIACTFLVENDSIVIDSAVSTNLKEEYLYNKDGLLEIKMKSIKGKKSTYFVNALYPSVFEKPLIQLKINDLKKVLDKHKESISNYDEINKTVSSEIRRALYSLMNKNNCLNLVENEIDVSKEDIKDIFSELKKQFPIFFLFKADRENKDGDSEVQNPLKVATKSALKEVEDKLDEVTKHIETQVKKIGEETIAKLMELDENIAENLETSVNTKNWDSLFSFDLIDDRNIPLNKRGSGVRRLLLLSYFRAEAERRMEAKSNSNVIYAIEEPETAQHPNYQKMIMETFLELAQKETHQIIVTTHTPEIAKMVNINQIIFIKKNKSVPEIVVDEEVKFKDVKESLGIHDYFEEKLVIFVEGDTDVSYLKNIGKLEEFKNIIDINSEDISIIPLVGSNLNNWIKRDYLKKSNIKEIHIYDGDKEENKKNINELNESKDARRTGIVLKRNEIENYVPIELISNRFGLDLSEYENEWCKLDVPKLLEGKLKHQYKEIDIKRILDGELSKSITVEMLRNMNVYDEILSWFNAIKELYI